MVSAKQATKRASTKRKQPKGEAAREITHAVPSAATQATQTLAPKRKSGHRARAEVMRDDTASDQAGAQAKTGHRVEVEPEERYQLIAVLAYFRAEKRGFAH